MLTQKDLEAIRKLIGFELDERLEEKLNEKLKFFPTKDEFFKRMDQIMAELETIRTEQLLITHSQEETETRLDKLEKMHPHGQHQFKSSS